MQGETPRKLVVGAFVTLDGVMQAPGAPDEDRTGGFAFGGWSVPHWDAMMQREIAEQMRGYAALLLGRKTYDVFASSWPKVDGSTDPVAAKLNAMPKYVASRKGSKFTWENTTFLQGDVAGAVRELKAAGGGPILVQGSSDLVQTLLEHDLVDEFLLWTFPVVVGPGKRLFGEGTRPAAFRLVDSKTSSTGVTLQRFARAGEVATGSFTVEGEVGVED